MAGTHSQWKQRKVENLRYTPAINSKRSGNRSLVEPPTVQDYTKQQSIPTKRSNASHLLLPDPPSSIKDRYVSVNQLNVVKVKRQLLNSPKMRALNNKMFL